MKKTLLSLILVAFSLSISAATQQLQPIEEMPNTNNTTDWMKLNTRKISKSKQYQMKLDEERRKLDNESVDVCIYSKSKQAMLMCEESISLQKSGSSAVEPVKLMIKAAMLESDENARLKMIEHASSIARKRMNQDAFERLIDEVSI